jgi:two-component system sensor histidine kinase GlrK
LLLDVMDSGPGIPADDRNRIFEAFYQGKTPQGGHVKGTGIGLSVVTEFVNAHGGSIEILESKSGGAHFRVRLPLRPAAAATREKAHAA